MGGREVDVTTIMTFHQGGGRRRGHGRRATMLLSSSSSSVVLVLVVAVLSLIVVEKNNSRSTWYTAVSALQTSRIIKLSRTTRTTTSSRSLHHPSFPPHVLNLGPMDDLSEYGKNKQISELDTLSSKREAIKRAKLANIKPNDDEPRLLPLTPNNNDDNDDNISHEELQQLLLQLQKEKESEDDDNLFAMPEFKTKRIVNQRGLSSGNYGGDTTSSSNSNTKALSNNENDTKNEDEDDEDGNNNLFIDWTTDYNDENEFHIPNRIGITTQHWGDVKLGYVDGKKLKKKDRALGKYNKNDLKVR